MITWRQRPLFGLAGGSGMTRREQSQLWRAASRGAKANGDMESYRRYARTAAIIEGRPWKIDRNGDQW